MQNQNPQPDPERTPKAERSSPIPLADRRRLVRNKETSDKKTHIYSDWASI